MDISDWRDKIDEIDRQIVELLSRRAHCVVELGRLKRALGLPIYEPQREDEILRNIAAVNRGPLDGAALRRVFERIIDEGRAIQRIPMEAPRSDDSGPAIDTELNQPDKD